MGYNDYIARGDASALIPEQAYSEIMKPAAQQSVFLANAKRLPNMARGQETLHVLSALALVYMVEGDQGLIQTAQAAWANKFIYAKSMAVIVPIPRTVVADAEYDIWGEVKPIITDSVALAVDRLTHFGLDALGNAAPTDWPDGIAIAAVAAGNYVVLGTGADLYEDTLGENGHIGKMEAQGFEPTAHVAALGMKAKLRGVRDSDGTPIFRQGMVEGTRYSLDGSPIVFPKDANFGAAVSGYHMVSTAYNEFVYSFRQEIEWELLTQGVINNAAGQVVFNFGQQHMVGLKATLRWGWQCPNPINRVQATEASRYPAAVLQAA
jgi:HK97 family phage major capsid protein